MLSDLKPASDPNPHSEESAGLFRGAGEIRQKISAARDQAFEEAARIADILAGPPVAAAIRARKGKTC